MTEIKAYLYIRHLITKEIIKSIPLYSVNQRHVEKVMRGILINLGEDYYIDDSEVESAQEQETPKS